MSRWIDKLIARHLEPDHNVRPLLSGAYSPVIDPTMPMMEEVREETAVEPEDRPAAKMGRVQVREGDKAPVTNALHDEKRGMRLQERLDADGEEFKPLDPRPAMEGGVPPGRSSVTVQPETIRETGREDPPAFVEQDVQRGESGAGPAMEVHTFFQARHAEVLVEPVLQDSGERVPMTDVKTDKRPLAAARIPGIVKESPSALNVLHTEVSPVVSLSAPVRQTVNVSIGRIEIKAIIPPMEVKPAPVKKGVEALGLDQYLEQRNPAKR